MRELLPVPHSPLIATVRGGKVFLLRRNRESPSAIEDRPSTSRSSGSRGLSLESCPSTSPIFDFSVCSSSRSGGVLRAGNAKTMHRRRAVRYQRGGHIHSRPADADASCSTASPPRVIGCQVVPPSCDRNSSP